MKLVVLAAFAAIVFLSDAAHADPITLKLAPSVDGPKITLGDLFTGEAFADNPTLARVAIGPSPRPGRRSAIEAAWLETTAREHGIAWSKPDGLSKVIVSRAGQPVPNDHITATITEALKEKTSLAGVLVNIEETEIWIAAGVEPSVAVESIDYDATSGRFTARISAPADSQDIFAVHGRAKPALPVATLMRDVKAGDLIALGDVSLTAIESGRVAQDAITDADSLVGYAAKRQMRAGQKLRQGDVERPRMLKKGEVVTLIYEVPGMTLTAMGRAVTDGATGDIISVINAQSHRTVEAKVTGAGTVTVEARMPIQAQASLAANERGQ